MVSGSEEVSITPFGSRSSMVSTPGHLIVPKFSNLNLVQLVEKGELHCRDN